ncbi:MAG: tetratricopeptide repeat protein [Nostoc sp.]|uniref:tetratricopeptide repeat protein n=1 Tax=Nostoc sp. TaxID=1180 RepID=UPI002FF7EBE7
MTSKQILVLQKLILLVAIAPLVLVLVCNPVCNSKCYLERGIAAYKQGNFAQAELAFRSSIKNNSNLPSAYNNLGVTLVKQKQLDRAIVAFRKSLELAPNYGEAQANLGFALEKKGDLQAATAEFTKQLPTAPDSKRSALSLELGLPEGLGVLAEKIASYQSEIKSNPSSWKGYYNLGVALDQQGDLAGAIAAYKETIRLNPTFAEAYGNLGNALVLSGQKAEGLAYMRRCRDLFEQQGRKHDLRKAEELIKQLEQK